MVLPHKGKPDMSGLFVPLCTVFPIEYKSRYGHFQTRVIDGSWLNLGPSDIVAGAWRIYDTVTRTVRVHYHCWFMESMQNRRDALTNFDLKLMPNLQRLAVGKEKVLLTKEERQALKLRELYANPKTTPRGEVTIEGIYFWSTKPLRCQSCNTALCPLPQVRLGGHLPEAADVAARLGQI